MMRPPTNRWRKSSYSNGMGGECVEVAASDQGVAVRDSKDPHGPRIALRAPVWGDFVTALRQGRLR